MAVIGPKMDGAHLISVRVPYMKVVEPGKNYLRPEISAWIDDPSRKGRWWVCRETSTWETPARSWAVFRFDDPDTAFEFKMRWA